MLLSVVKEAQIYYHRGFCRTSRSFFTEAHRSTSLWKNFFYSVV